MNRVKPTKLQLKTLEIKRDNPDMPMGRAMIKAGYSPKTALNAKANFVESRGGAIAIEQWREKLRGIGITDDFMAKKQMEWVTATKIKSSMTEPDRVVPDYETQLKAADMIRKDFGITQQSDHPTNLKQRIIAEEFFE